MKRNIRTKMISMVLSVVMIISWMTVPVGAALGGYCGKTTYGLSYLIYEDGFTVISGSGSMADYKTSADLGSVSPFNGNKDIKTLLVENGAKTIGDAAFYNCSELSVIQFPDTVRMVGAYAFYGCEGLTHVRLSEGTNEIGGYAFYGCTGLKTITIPGSLLAVGGNVFANCTSLTDIYYGGTEESWNRALAYGTNSIPPGTNIHYTEPTTESTAEPTIEPTESTEPAATLMPTRSPLTPLEIEAKNRQAYLNENSYLKNEGVSRWASCLKRYIFDDNGDTFKTLRNFSETRGGVSLKIIDINTYSKTDYSLLKTQYVPFELSQFGGFYSGENYNYMVFGQDNLEEDDDLEVVRVVKYDKDFNRLDAVSVSNCDVSNIFKSGSLRMCEKDNQLYVYTSRRYHKRSDGLNHQASLLLIINTDDMV